jgi:hypothetical protein
MSDGKLTHCPKCHKPLLNGARFFGNAQFNLRCPWCQSVVTVTVQQQISANLKSPDANPIPQELVEFYQPSEQHGAMEFHGRSRKVGRLHTHPSRRRFQSCGVFVPPAKGTGRQTSWVKSTIYILRTTCAAGLRVPIFVRQAF